MKRVLITGAVALIACSGRSSRSGTPDPCPADTTVYAFADTTRGITPPVLLYFRPPRPGLSKVTAEVIVDPRGRVERGSLRTSGRGHADERWAAGDALLWSEFSPARRDGCPVRFRYQVTFVAGRPVIGGDGR